MERPSIVPKNLSNAINYKIIIVIFTLVITTHLVINYGPGSENKELTSSIVSMINPMVAGVTSVIVGFRYSMTNVFTRAYVSLGIGLICAGIGEILYVLYDIVFNINPFPSFADVFFLAYYPFILAHLIINLRFFKLKYSKKIVMWLICFPIIYTSTFFTFYEYVDSFEMMVSMAYIIPDSIALALVVVGANLFRHGTIGAAWFILLIGMFFISSADFWYYHLESSEEYSLDHPVNILWYAGYWVVTYALLKHKMAI